MEQQHSVFVRIAIYILATFIAILIGTGYFLGEPKYQLSTDIIILILILVVLFLSESFNNLSIGKILTISKDYKKKEVENKELKSENSELRNQIINVATNVSQSQVTYNGISSDLLKLLKVVPAGDNTENDKTDFEKEDEEKIATDKKVENKEPKTEVEKFLSKNSSKRKLMQYIEQASLNSILNELNIPSTDVQGEVRFTSALEGLDPIMENSVTFDGYYQLEREELFFELIRSDTLRPERFYYLYQMLSKIFLYRKAKKIKAELILIIIDIPESMQYRPSLRNKSIERLISQFKPSTDNELLKIKTISYSEEQIADMVKDIISNKTLERNSLP